MGRTGILLEVGKAYLAKYKRPPVLVIDAADKIYKKNPNLLLDIQALAKDGADSGCLRVVFVISETSAFEMPQSHSHASRSRTFLVGEIEDDEAVDWLRRRREQERHAWAPGACWVGTTSLTNLVSAQTCWCLGQHVWAVY